MTNMHSSIIHNLTILLESGAYGHSDSTESIVAMSPHKWRKLVSAAANMNIMRYIAAGAEHIKDNEAVPPALFMELEKCGADKEMPAFDHTTAHLFNHWTQKKLDEVREEEMNSPNTSDETLTLLDYIIKNAEYIITQDTSIEGIISMGCYIRNNKEHIDYNKLNSWLSGIGLVQTASMEGNMLISCMHFAAEELPFVIKPFHRAQRLFMNSIIKVFDKHSFSTRTRLNVAMLETVSHRFMSAISLVTDIEE